MHDDRGELRQVERNVVRIVVLDTANHVLLLQTRDLGNAAFGTSWELPGGAWGDIHRSCSKRAARGDWYRSRANVRWQPTWRRDVAYTYRGERRLQHEVVTLVRLDEAAPDVAGSHRVDFESEDHFGHRWWAIDEIVCSGERFYPRHLPKLLHSFLAGDEIAEQLERWP